MKNRFIIVILFIWVSHNSFTQIDSVQITKNLIYIELGGAGGYGSINYERTMYCKNKIMFAIRSGISSYHIVDYTNKFNPDILIPLSLSGLYGQNHKVEMSVGETFSNIVHAHITDFKPLRTTSFHTFFSVGYRYQKKSAGIVFRFAYTPIIEFNKYYRHWAGISLGYSF